MIDDNKIFEPEDEYWPPAVEAAALEVPPAAATVTPVIPASKPKRVVKRKPAATAEVPSVLPPAEPTYTADQVGQIISTLIGDNVIVLSAERACLLWEKVVGGKLTLVYDQRNETVCAYLDVASLKQTLPQLIKLL